MEDGFEHVYFFLWDFVTNFSYFIKNTPRLTKKSRKAKLAIQKPARKIIILTPVGYAVKIHVPMVIAEKSRVSPRNADSYFCFPFIKREKRPKSKVKI